MGGMGSHHSCEWEKSPFANFNGSVESWGRANFPHWIQEVCLKALYLIMRKITCTIALPTIETPVDCPSGRRTLQGYRNGTSTQLQGLQCFDGLLMKILGPKWPSLEPWRGQGFNLRPPSPPHRQGKATLTLRQFEVFWSESWALRSPKVSDPVLRKEGTFEQALAWARRPKPTPPVRGAVVSSVSWAMFYRLYHASFLESKSFCPRSC